MRLKFITFKPTVPNLRDRVVFLFGRREYSSLSPVAVHLAFSTAFKLKESSGGLALSRAVVWSILNDKPPNGRAPRYENRVIK